MGEHVESGIQNLTTINREDLWVDPAGCLEVATPELRHGLWRIDHLEDFSDVYIPQEEEPEIHLSSVWTPTLLTSIAYDLLGRKDYMVDANMGTWDYEYDSNGRLDIQTDNIGQYIDNDYDSVGRIVTKSVYDSGGVLEKTISYSYDTGDADHDVGDGELFEVEEYDGSGTLLRWTKYGYETSYRRTNKVTRYLPDIGELTQEISQDYRGIVESASYPGGANLYYAYDRLNNLMDLCSESDCNTTTGINYYSIDPSSAYDAFGALQGESYGNGIETEYDYFSNSHRMQEKRTYKGSTNYSQRTYEYDEYSNITALTDPLNLTGSAAFTSLGYDNLNRLNSYTEAATATTLSFGYDSQGNMLSNSKVYGSNTYEYTSSRPHAVTQIGSDTFDYDANGNMTSDPDRTMEYNAENQLTKVTMKNGVVVDYAYDYTGARISKHVTREDPLHHIHEATTYYLGDAMEIKGDQLIFHIHARDMRVATKSLGNITELLTASGSNLRRYGITPPIQFATTLPYIFIFLTLFIIGTFRPIKARKSLFAVRGLSFPRRRESSVFAFIQSTIHDLQSASSAYTHSMREALHSFPQNAYAKGISLVLIFLFTIQFPLISIAGDTGTPAGSTSDENYFYYHHGDHLGSSHVLTEGNKEGGKHSGIFYNQGDLVQRIEYAPFGQETYVLNPNLTFDPRYTGQEYDIETGLYYYKSRYYNPKLARFIQPDTVVPDGKNLQAYNKYSYVINNPLKYVDPSGHGFWSWFKQILGAFVGALIGVLVGILTFGAMTVPGMAAAQLFWAGVGAAVIGGMAGGLIGGAITGGLSGAIMGMLMGFAGGLVFGAAGQFVPKPLLIGASISLTYAKQGWKGLVTFGAGILGSLAGYGLAGAMKSGETNDLLEGEGGGDVEGEAQMEKILQQSMTEDIAKSGNIPLAYRNSSEYQAALARVQTQSQFGVQPMSALEKQILADINRDLMGMAGLSLGIAAAPEIAGLCAANPIGCYSFGEGFLMGFLKGAGLGQTGFISNNGYEAIGNKIGEMIGENFDF